MKYKFLFLILLSFIFTTLKAQTTQTSPVTIHWNGIEKWTIGDSMSVNVISFRDARYPNENRLPYFNHRIECDPAFVYAVDIINPQYIPLSVQEMSFFEENNEITNSPNINNNILNSRGIKYLDINILPFATIEGKIMKLKSFDLEISEQVKAQKVAASQLHTYAENSVLATGKFIKIKISNTGVYKLTYEDLTSMGVNPANVRVFGYGGAILDQNFSMPKIDDLPEIAISMQKGTDGIFNAGDYILFYAQGIMKWTYDTTKQLFIHQINSYSTAGYYFVSSDAGIGKKIENKAIEVPANAIIQPVEEFTDYTVYESDKTSLIESGKEFYGEKFNDITTYNFNFNFPNVLKTNSTNIRLDVASNSTTISSFSMMLNSAQEKILNVSKRNDSDIYELAKGGNGTFNYTPQSDNFAIKLTYSKPSSTSVGYLNYIEINARRQLIMSGSAMQFQNVDNLGLNIYNKYKLSDANANVQIWDITDQQNISKVEAENIDNKLTFTSSGNDVNTYLAIDPTAAVNFPKPEIVGQITNQNLHGISPVDLVIITHPDFLAQAETLAQAHREKDLMTVAVVTTEQVYNEFSSGTPDATAYRWVMKRLYDRALKAENTDDAPKYLLLFGRGTYDNRKLLSSSGDNFILTYQAENSLVLTLSYVTDDYFGFLDDNEGSNVPANLVDIGVGRFPVTTTQEATDVVNKTISYMNNQSKGNWKNQLCYLADDGDAALHMKQADSVASMITRLYPSYQVNKIYLDAYLQEISASGETYPLAKSRFQNLLRSGLLVLDYTGHAGPAGWSNESILSVNDVKSLSNKHLPIFIGATCDFLQFDVKTVSAGEHVVLNSSGGGIGILSAARPVYASQNLTINKLFNENLFKKINGYNPRIGDVLKVAKNNVGTEINKLSYIYMGDPALMLNYPNKYTVKTSQINENSVLGNDTLRALSIANIVGFIEDENGNKVTNFNGTIQATVYDKIQRITTLNNENDGALTYSDRPNTLFSGKAEVKNGDFSISFMLPKDIKYNYGTGRINFYAEDDVNDNEAQGYFENFIIGGTDKSYEMETDGPSAYIYLNSQNFVSGNKVNETPLFIANVNDISGINTVGSGIGHDILITIDQDPTQSYVLNDYFESAANSYSQGVVYYKLPEMEDGKHTLTFRVWDLLNNSTTKTIEFEVQKGLTPEIFNVSNFPNPVKVSTNIVVNHDRPETILKTTVEIFDLSGRKIWSFSQSTADNIKWDLKTNNGQKVGNGIYLYKVSIKTSDSDIVSKTNKMLIIEQ
ncbi:MAG: type IX secretion system sortase PorU [Paludibacter sp.]|nr:type IX secretion system sortase PorU [Paludibacter sp.]